MNVVRKCVSLLPNQDQRIKEIQMKTIQTTNEVIAYSKVLQMLINLGLEKIDGDSSNGISGDKKNET